MTNLTSHSPMTEPNEHMNPMNSQTLAPHPPHMPYVLKCKTSFDKVTYPFVEIIVKSRVWNGINEQKRECRKDATRVISVQILELGKLSNIASYGTVDLIKKLSFSSFHHSHRNPPTGKKEAWGHDSRHQVTILAQEFADPTQIHLKEYRSNKWSISE